MKQEKIIELLRNKKAMLEGHFLLTSGRHSNIYIEKFRLLEDPILLDKICKQIASKLINLKVDIVDPWVGKSSINENYKIKILNKTIKDKKYSSVICTVAHKQFVEMSLMEWRSLLKDNGVLFDLKGLIPRELNPIRI